MTKLAFALALLGTSPALAQYNNQAGRSAPVPEAAPAAQEEPADEDRPKRRRPQRKAEGTDTHGGQEPRSAEGGASSQAPVQMSRDTFGNAQGSQYDLAVDGAFEGQTILIVDFYSFVHHQDFSGPKNAVRTKGFSMVRYPKAPEPKELKALLAKANQFWLIASCDNRIHLTVEHHRVIREFFEAGHGVYLWGDNDPCNADADALATLLIGARIKGDVPGDQTVRISAGPGKPGVTRDHLLTTGVENVYEGVTVATVSGSPNTPLTPIIWGSGGNLVTAAYEKKGKRLLIDGGFTRLSYKWDTAGTGRYIRNAAAWLANYEKFGDQVTAKKKSGQ